MKIHGYVFNVRDNENGAIIEVFTTDDTRKIENGAVIDARIVNQLRTLKQNDFFHEFVRWALKFYLQVSPDKTDWTFDRLKRHWKRKYGYIISYSVEINGKKTFDEEEISTASLDKFEFCEFFDACMLYALNEVGAPVYDEWIKPYEDWKEKHKSA